MYKLLVGLLAILIIVFTSMTIIGIVMNTRTPDFTECQNAHHALIDNVRQVDGFLDVRFTVFDVRDSDVRDSAMRNSDVSKLVSQRSIINTTEIARHEMEKIKAGSIVVVYKDCTMDLEFSKYYFWNFNRTKNGKWIAIAAISGEVALFSIIALAGLCVYESKSQN